mgnify:CR=1 FL=1
MDLWEEEKVEESLIKRVLPHSIEAEQSVIGSMLMDKEAILAASRFFPVLVYSITKTKKQYFRYHNK